MLVHHVHTPHTYDSTHSRSANVKCRWQSALLCTASQISLIADVWHLRGQGAVARRQEQYSARWQWDSNLGQHDVVQALGISINSSCVVLVL